jgi:hypothetical protein
MKCFAPLALDLFLEGIFPFKGPGVNLKIQLTSNPAKILKTYHTGIGDKLIKTTKKTQTL